jgi:hypothetical protein
MRSCIKAIIHGDSFGAKLSILSLASLVLLIRRTDSFINPQFWAEDGAIFFAEQYYYGLSVITQPYAGYLQLIPRLIALFSQTFLSYAKIPFAYNLSSLIITLVIIASVLSRRLDAKYKGLYAISLVLIPDYRNEVFINITNIQWILCALLVVLVIKEAPDAKYGNIKTQYATDVITVFLCGLTGPFLIFMIPLFVWKWLQSNNKYNSVMVLAAALIATIQLFFVVSEAARSGNSYINADMGIYKELFGIRILGGLLFGNMAHAVDASVSSVIYLGIIMILSWYALRDNKIGVFLYVHVIIVLATLYKYKATPDTLIPEQNGPRYFYIPYLMIAWALLSMLEAEKKNWRRALVSMGLLCILYSSLSCGFRSSFIDYDWKFYSGKIGQADVMIPINPEGWWMYISARK